MSSTAYEKLQQEIDEVHPVDRKVELLLPQWELRQKIREKSQQLLEVQRDLWLELEALLNERRIEREELYFNLGHEYGKLEGRGEGLRSFGNPPLPEARSLLNKLRDAMLQSDL